MSTSFLLFLFLLSFFSFSLYSFPLFEFLIMKKRRKAILWAQEIAFKSVLINCWTWKKDDIERRESLMKGIIKGIRSVLSSAAIHHPSSPSLKPIHTFLLLFHIESHTCFIYRIDIATPSTLEFLRNKPFCTKLYIFCTFQHLFNHHSLN